MLHNEIKGGRESLCASNIILKTLLFAWEIVRWGREKNARILFKS